MEERDPVLENGTYVSEMGDIEVKENETMDNKQEDNKEKPKNKKRGFFYEWGIPVIAAFILAALINKFLIFKVWIPSESMVPTLNVEDRLFVSRVYNPENLERGDIVVFYSDELQEDLIKRLIGLPGDKISIRDGVVSVNGEALTEPYIGAPDKYNNDFEVPQGKYFFLGDNRLWSKDSRYWANPYIDANKIEGKAQVKVYPFSQFGWVK